MKQVNIYQAKTELSKLIEEVISGGEVIIARNGTPLARLIPYVQQAKKRRFGILKGRIRVDEDFDAELPEDILKDFEG